MSAYVVGQLKFTNLSRYNRYQSNFMDVFKNFNGELLVADEKPTVIEGEWKFQKIVILKFENKHYALSFMNSPEYEKIAIDRKAGAEATLLLVSGL